VSVKGSGEKQTASGSANPALDLELAYRLAADANQSANRLTLLQQVQAHRTLEEQLSARLTPYLKRLGESVDRIGRLLQFFDQGLSEREGGQDVLRAAVVFTHAFLEDFLRTLAGELLPVGDENSLKDVPLVGTGSFGRGEKFALGQLAQHRGKTVDQLLHQSVAEYLGRSNYNDTTEIAVLLTRLGFRVEDHNKAFAAIDRMIQRRHQIVHRADWIIEMDKPVLQPIDRSDVVEWLRVTSEFTSSLLTPLLQKLPQLLGAK